jgi:RNA polymerase-binding transcription factor DksA
MSSYLKLRLEKLCALRANLLGGMARTEDDSMSDHHRTGSIPTDIEELASDGTNQEIMLTLLGSDEDTLDQVETAIRRVEGGGYGRCAQCGVQISRNRLDAIPYASECVPCASREADYARY